LRNRRISRILDVPATEIGGAERATMTTYRIPSSDSVYNVTDSFANYVLVRRDSIWVPGSDGIFIDTSYINDQVVIAGQLVSTDTGNAAFASSATGTKLVIAVSGSIRGPDIQSIGFDGVGSTFINHGLVEGGVGFGGDNGKITNTGTIASTQDSAISAFASGMEIHNSGALYGGHGIYCYGDHNTIVLDATSVISAGTGIYNKAGVDMHIVNAGRITAPSAIWVNDGTTIVNTGIIEGAINLSSDADRFDDRGGTIDGTVIGGGGDDMLITDKATDILSEQTGGGTDTVKSTVSYKLSANVENLALLGKADIDATGNGLANVITGNAGANTLSGGGGTDILDGALGNDTLAGGAGADVFLFETHGGQDVVTKFEDGDLLNFSRWDAIQSWSELVHGGHLVEDNGNLVIEAGKDSLTLEHMTKADLTKADVSFDPLT
jgi:Ca2+-binding RTX toxin-like protein